VNLDRLKQSYAGALCFYEKVKARLDVSARDKQQKFAAIRQAYYRAYWDDVVAAYGARMEDVGYNILRISKGGQHTYVRESEVMLDNHLSLNMMGNKPLTHKLLRQSGHPVPKHQVFTLSNIGSAYKFQEELGKLVVVKPAGGGAGRGVTTKISESRQLKKAAQWAAIFHAQLLVEEQVQGESYRFLYLDGRLIDVVRRDAPAITGDGINSIRTLIDQENDQRLNGETVTALSPIVIDMDCKNKLHEQSTKLTDIPDAGQVVIVKDVINQNSARENHSIPESKIHPSTIALGKSIAVDFGLELIGLDVISEDISLSFEETGGVINEVNTTPGLHHHDLVANKSSQTNVPEQILDYIFSNARKSTGCN
jgi:D-alanine-D-alanine ligase-like ATP-grasp enzyme